MVTKAFLGIDAGTQGLSVILADESLVVLGVGESEYGMLPGLAEGNYEQDPADWELAAQAAMQDLRENLPPEHSDFEVLSIGIAGQMHGEVLADDDGQLLGPARLWCDGRNDAEGVELTKRLGIKMPKRITAARWLWTIRNRSDTAQAAAKMTTPAGWLAFRLTGQWKLGIGDASGMFPISQETLGYDQKKLNLFEELLVDEDLQSLDKLLPVVCRAGQDGGQLNEHGAALLGLPVGVPLAPAEGDQPASLAGSLIDKPGMVSVSFGTSVVANSVGDHAFEGVSPAVDHFCAPDGKPINMVWLRNGTTFMNSVVEMFAGAMGEDRSAGFATLMPMLLQAAPDCGGLIALPFMDDEPGLGVTRGGTAMLMGLNPGNATPGNAVKAALLATMFNLLLGSEVLDRQGFPRTELVLSGGMTKTPELAQVLADVFNTPVTLLESAEEGCAWGAALLAKFRYLHITAKKKAPSWADYVATQRDAATGRTRFEPDPAAASAYKAVYQRYQKLMKVQPDLLGKNS